MTTADPLEGVHGRAAVEALLPEQVERALLVAREIRDPWYRCQALTFTARHLNDGDTARDALLEALDAAYQQNEPNRIVTIASWPISVLSSVHPDVATEHTTRLLGIAASEAHTLRRADALIRLFEAVYKLPVLRESVFHDLLVSLRASHGWRAQRLLRQVALIVAESSPDEALELLNTLPDDRPTRSTRRMITAREWLGPHDFVPYYQKPPDRQPNQPLQRPGGAGR